MSRKCVAESVGSEGYRLPASNEQLDELAFPQKQHHIHVLGRH